MFSRSASQAIQVMGYLARNNFGQPQKLEQVSDATGIPRHAVVKVVQAMHKQRLLNTSRGSRGGVVIARSPAAVRLSEIVCAVDDPPDECPVSVGNESCQPQSDCSIFKQWKRLAEQVQILEHCYDLKTFADQNIRIDIYD
jgi:Rrf2 family protein